MKKCKRMLSLLCAIVLVVSLMAPTALALQGPDVSVPDNYDLLYFVDCGADAFPDTIQTLLEEHADTVKNADTPDQAYDDTWGYTSEDATDVYNSSSQDVYESFRCFKETANGQTLQYKFAADAGQYKVYVGLYDPWTAYNQVRKGSVSVNNGAAQTHTYSQGAKLMSFDVTVAGDEGLTVDIAPVGDTVDKDHDVLVSFIMVSKKAEEPQPEAPEAPTPDTLIWGKGGNTFKLDVTYSCTNADATHEDGNSGTDKVNFLYGRFFIFGEMTQDGEVWEIPAQFNAAAYLSEKFGVPHTAENVPVTLEYVNKKWCIQSEQDKAYLTAEGVCESTGPAAPTQDNCSFTITVYGQEPQSDGSNLNFNLDGWGWERAVEKGLATVEFGTPAKDETGTWTCTATVDATTFVEQVAEAKASSNYFREEGDPTTKTVKLTYNQNKQAWEAEEDGVQYGYPSSLTTKRGVAFRLIKYYTVTLTPGRDLTGSIPEGEEEVLGAFKTGTTVELPETAGFTAGTGVFAGWRVVIKDGSTGKSTVYFYPVGTDMTMFAEDVEAEAYWMNVVLDVASQPYDSGLGVEDYTFGDSANFTMDGDTITVLYRAQVQGNSEYPYVLTCEGAQAVYDSELNGAIDKYDASEYVYFTVTYTAAQAAELTEETVAMGNASASAAVTVEVEDPAPALPVPGETLLYFADGEWVDVTVTCTNENAVHKPDNTKVLRRNTISKQYLKAVSQAQKDENGLWTCQVTLDGAAMLKDNLAMEHTAEDVVVTAVYNVAKGRWELPAEPLTFTGTCTQNGPEAPTKDNCTDFYLTVYGYEPQVDDTVRYSSLSGRIWYVAQSNGVSITFSEPQKNEEGQWTCEATVNAEEWVEEVYQDKASSHYRRDDTDPTTKTVTLTYDQSKGKWVAEPDGIDYGTATKPETKNGVAFRLVKQYTVTFGPGRDLEYKIPTGDKVDGGAYDKGATVQLPQTTHFVAENGVFAGWKVTIKKYINDPNSVTYYYPLGTESIPMFGKDVEIEAYWMDVELEVASVPYDESLTAKDYTFGTTADFVIDGETVTLLYRANVRGNSKFPYALTVYGPEATAVYGSELEGTIDNLKTSEYVYFTVTYTEEEFEAMTQQTVALGNASASVDVTVTAEHTPQLQNVQEATDTQDGYTGDLVCTGCGKVLEKGQAYELIFRVFNPGNGKHHYTSDAAERDALVAGGWIYEGVAWNAPKEGKPVYRVYQPSTGNHLYTMDEAERDALVEGGWQYEGILCYSADESGTALYRVRNPYTNLNPHHYTNSKEECDFLEANGWVVEGIAWYGLTL